MNTWLFVLLAGLVGASAFFSGMETALFSLRENKIRRLREKDLRLALALERLTADRKRLLAVILFSDVIVNVPLVLLCLYLAERLPMQLLPVWATTLILFGVVVVLCDLLPKLLALTHPLRLAPLAVRYLDFAVPLLGRITGVLERATEKLSRMVTPRSMEARDTLSGGEFATLMNLGAETGVIDSNEREIIAEIMKLADKTAKDCMTPRVDSFTMPDDLTNEEAITLLRMKRRRLVPIYGETPDDILGVLDVAVFLANPTQPYQEILVPPSFVAETMNALELLQSFLHRPQRIAIVVDEFGGTEGVVTFSDIVEEVISDAVPLGTELYIEDAGEGKLIVSGHARLDDISEKLETTIEHEGLDTIGGYIFNKMGYVPRPGSVVDIPGYTLRIRRATRRRVQEVFIEPVAEEDLPELTQEAA
ncbi:MAG TPA: hemolysin family protein [Chthoniobacterales bacterium]